MRMTELVEGVRQRREWALGMGGPERVARQHAKGSLTVRERIDRLLDPGSFVEIGMLAHSIHPGTLQVRAPADAIITGFGRINGRTVCLNADDFTVLGGSWGTAGIMKSTRMIELALKYRHPFIWLCEGGGGRVDEEMGVQKGAPPREGGGNLWLDFGKLAHVVPKVAGMMGSCYGATAFFAGLSHFVVMPKGASMGAGGPPVVAEAVREVVSTEELGGYKLQAELGQVDRIVESDEEAMALIREWLSYMPDNSSLEPPLMETADDPERRDEELIGILPESANETYDMNEIIKRVVDDGKYFPLKPDFGRSLITCLARMGGRTVGILATQPMHKGGALDTHTAEKEEHFVEVCNTFNIPLVFLVDVPGYVCGTKGEKPLVLRWGVRALQVLHTAKVPKVAVVIRKAYGIGVASMCAALPAADVLLAWPGAEISVMGSEAKVRFIYQRQLGATESSEELRERLLADQKSQVAALTHARWASLDDVIDPRDTRPAIIKFLQMMKAGKAP